MISFPQISEKSKIWSEVSLPFYTLDPIPNLRGMRAVLNGHEIREGAISSAYKFSSINSRIQKRKESVVSLVSTEMMTELRSGPLNIIH